MKSEASFHSKAHRINESRNYIQQLRQSENIKTRRISQISTETQYNKVFQKKKKSPRKIDESNGRMRKLGTVRND